MSKNLIMENSKSQYLEQWKETSSFFETNDCYKWMSGTLAKYIKSPRRILDIGCGAGEGIVSLLKQFGCQIICLEENDRCMKLTEKRIKSEGYDIQCIERIESNLDNASQYALSYANYYRKDALKNINLDSKVLIIQSDLYDYQEDDELYDLISSLQFDAVTCWLLGTHPLHLLNENIQDIAKGDWFLARYYAQQISCIMANSILRSGGIFNIVDRLGYNEYSEKKESIEADFEKCLLSSAPMMLFEQTEITHYQQPSVGIQMTNENGITNRNNVEKDLCSFFFRKRINETND